MDSKEAALRYLAELERSLDSTRDAKQRDVKLLLDAESDEGKLALVDAICEPYGIEPEGTDPDLAESARADLAIIEQRCARRRTGRVASLRVRYLRQHADVSPNGNAPARTTPRPRGRRARHIARATSSSDSGDSSSGESDPPPVARFRRAFCRARGLAECPLCSDEPIVRARCPLCGGLGFVGRELRNRWKNGWRP